MAAIPVGEVAFAGFGVIRRKPLAVLVWGLVLVLFLLSSLAMAACSFGAIFSTVAGAEQAEPAMAEMLALQAWMVLTQIGIYLLSILVQVVLMCAVYRAVLEPGDDRFAYLRLGRAELMVGLVYLCLSIILAVLFMGVLFVWLGVVLAAAAASEALGWGLGILVGAAALPLSAWVAVRLSMALPMTFAERRFRFFEAWELTRGHALNLILMMLIVIVMVLLIEIVLVAAVVLLGIVFSAAGAFDPAVVEDVFERPLSEWLAALAGFAFAAGIVFAIVGGALQAIAVAPWAAAYRALVPAADLRPAPGAV